MRITLYDARARAKKRGLLATIKLEQLLPLPKRCPLLGVDLDYGTVYGPNKATFDRKDSTKGYEPGNVWIISARANTLKSDATLGELKRLVANLEMWS